MLQSGRASTSPRFIGSEIYRRSSYGGWHPLRVPRVSTVMDLARVLGWISPGQYITSPRAKPAALTAWHTPEYVAALAAAEAAQGVTDGVRQRHGLGTVSNPVFPEMFRRPATAAGGSILSGELLASPGVVFHPAGGTHHGLPDRASGFCYLNDPVLAILSLRVHGCARVAYVDIDAHHGDGVEFAFADDPDVMVLSVHEERRWPFTGLLQNRGAGQVWNLPVPRGLNDTEMALIVDEVILPQVAAFRPDAILLQCGADAIEEDPLSRLSLSNWSHRQVVRGLLPLAPRVLVVGGGGYNPWSVGRAWTCVWAEIAGHEIPDRLPEHAQAVLRALQWSRIKAGGSPPEQWLTTLADPPHHGPIREEVRSRVLALRDRARRWL